MNTETREIKSIKDLTEEEKASGKWKEIPFTEAVKVRKAQIKQQRKAGLREWNDIKCQVNKGMYWDGCLECWRDKGSLEPVYADDVTVAAEVQKGVIV